MEGRIYGVLDEKYLRILVELFQKLGYKKGLTFHGVGGLDEISVKGNIRDFLRVLYGQEKGPKRELVLANAAAAFYIAGKVGDLKEGVRMAASLIDKGKASAKLEEYVTEAGDINKLKTLKLKLLK